MKFKLLFIIVFATLLPLLLATAPFSVDDVLAQPPEAPSQKKAVFRIDVSRHGFNHTPGEFLLVVEEGQEVEITFVYGDGDLPYLNSHPILITGYNIRPPIIETEVTIRFIADKPGEFSFMCIYPPCEGHENLLGGRLKVLPKLLVEEVGGALLLTSPEQAQSGQPLTLSVLFQDSQGQPIGNATVRFFIKVDFFASGLMEIGEATTSDQGMAVFSYTPGEMGEIKIVARYENIETVTTVNLTDGKPFYHAEAGIQFPALGQEVFIGPKSALELEDIGKAPTTAFRLPGGILSWFWLLLITVTLVWFTYFRVMYQVLRIPIVSEIRHIDTRLVPQIGLAIVVALGILLVLMLITGPYSHFHLSR